MKMINTHLFKETPEGIALVGQECRKCGKIAYPRKRVCPECFGENLEEKLLSRTGTLHTYTTVVLGVPHLKPPYTMGFVDLPEKIRVIAVLAGCDPEKGEPKVGMPVEIVLDKLMEDEKTGEDVYSYKFKPVGKKGSTP